LIFQPMARVCALNWAPAASVVAIYPAWDDSRVLSRKEHWDSVRGAYATRKGLPS